LPQLLPGSRDHRPLAVAAEARRAGHFRAFCMSSQPGHVPPNAGPTNRTVGSGVVDDRAAIAEWMSGQGLGEGPLENVTEIGGGTQNILRRFERSGRTYVLRRGPQHLRPISNKVILRETR